MTFVDAFVLAFAGFLIVLAARLAEAARRAEAPTKAEILARFDSSPGRLWLAISALGAADLVIIGLAFAAFGTSEDALFGFGAHGWVWGVTLVAAAGVVTVVLGTVVRTYLAAD